jgi:RNA polymerase sigma-54 factor
MVKNKQKGTLKIKFVPYMATRAKMFEMNILELNEFINQMIASNPFVEEARFAPEIVPPNDFEKYITASEDMYSNLLHQLRMLDIDQRTQEISEFMINSLNEEGYLTIPLEKIARQFNVPVKYVEKALKIVQSLEPPGIGARNLSECILLQLEAEGSVSPKIKHVILKHLKELADKKYKTISKETGLKIETLEQLRDKITHFTVSPGLAFKESKTKKIIIPDISIVKSDEGFKAYLNEKFMRRFFINEKYLDAIRKNSNSDSLIKMADQAKWTLRSFLERREMLLKFGTFVAENETEFLSGIMPYPKKHTTNEISRKLKTDESSL